VCSINCVNKIQSGRCVVGGSLLRWTNFGVDGLVASMSEMRAALQIDLFVVVNMFDNLLSSDVVRCSFRGRGVGHEGDCARAPSPELTMLSRQMLRTRKTFR